MEYVVIDFPEAGDLSLVEIEEGKTTKLLKKWKPGTLHQEVYNTIVSMSSRHKGDLMPELFLIPLHQIQEDKLQAGHWLFLQYHTTIQQAKEIFWNIRDYSASCSDPELSRCIEIDLASKRGKCIQVGETTYYGYKVKTAEDVVSVDIRCTPNMQAERFCRYCGRLFTKSKTGVYCSASCNSRFVEQNNWPYENRITTYKDFYDNNISPQLEEKRMLVSGYKKELDEAKRKGMTESVYVQQLKKAQQEFRRYYNAAEKWMEWQQREKEKIIEAVEKGRTEYIEKIKKLSSENRLEEDRPPEWHVGVLDSQTDKMWAAWNTYLHQENET